ncbi:G2E3-like protein [Mya arenaria]|uniref:G2E3-like protein n=1 Tax=Mya arenaria TaxID=6604 RepID=A0ABY7FAB4_MYAAR|nr:G2E3-like protein [Mya arenaria]
MALDRSKISLMLNVPADQGKGSSCKECVFCDSSTNDKNMYGKLLTRAGLTAHYFCMLFASGLSQNGKSEKQGVLGFLPEDIRKELKRASRLRCSYCKKVGATIGCVVKNCKKMFHLGCGKENHTLHQFYDTFRSYCPAHRPMQDVASDPDPNITCSICMNTVPGIVGYKTLQAPCCKKYWYHRDCIQQYATSAGLYFFKCPMCNNKDDFQALMLEDASWETEPQAFQELLERYDRCDAKTCRCAEGRKYDKEDTKWEIILCEFCGSSGSHIACSYLLKLGKRNENEVGVNSPAKSPQEMPQLDPVESPMSPKTSPYPGPSGSMNKKRLPSKVSSSPRISLEKHFSSPKSAPNSRKKRQADEEMRSPPKLKRVKSIAGRRKLAKSATCKNASSSPSSSEGELPPAWQKIEEARQVEKERKRKKKYTGGAGQRRKSVNVVMNKKGLNSDSEDEPLSVLLSKKKGADRRKTVCGVELQRENTVATNKKRMSLTNGSELKQEHKKRKYTKMKRPSLDKAQTVLTHWFPKSNANRANDNVKADTNTVKVPSEKKKAKMPMVIEWKGKQLLIYSPRVVLKRSKGLGVMKPRNLEIDMNDRKGGVDLTKGIDMLSTIDMNVRLTRNMLDMDNEMVDLSTDELKEQPGTEKPEEELMDSSANVTKEMPPIKRPKFLEIDMKDGGWSKEMEVIATLATDQRITRQMLDSDVSSPLKKISASDAYCDDSPKPLFAKKRKAELQTKAAERKHLLEKGADQTSHAAESKRFLEKRADQTSRAAQRKLLLGKGTDQVLNGFKQKKRSRQNRMSNSNATPGKGELKYSVLREQLTAKIDTREVSLPSTNSKGTQCQENSFVVTPLKMKSKEANMKGFDDMRQVRELTPTSKKSNSFPFPSINNLSNNDGIDRSLKGPINLNETYIVHPEMNALQDSPAKNLRVRKAQESLQKTVIGNIPGETSTQKKTVAETSSTRTLNSESPKKRIFKNAEFNPDIDSSPAKNLRRRSTTCKMSINNIDKQSSHEGDSWSNTEKNSTQSKSKPQYDVRWYFEGTRQIGKDATNKQCENTCPITNTSPSPCPVTDTSPGPGTSKAKSLALKLSTVPNIMITVEKEKRHIVPYTSLQLIPESETGVSSGVTSSDKNLSPFYLTKSQYPHPRNAGVMDIRPSVPSTRKNAIDFSDLRDNEPLTGPKSIRALNDMRDKYMQCLSPEHFNLNVDVNTLDLVNKGSELDTDLMAEYYVSDHSNG